MLSDIQQFRTNYGLGQGDVKFVPMGRPGATDPDDQVEADLDLEWAGAIAPNATLIYVYGADADSSAFYAIDQNLAPIISESFGVCEAYMRKSAAGLHMKPRRKKGTRWESRGSPPAAIPARRPAIPAKQSQPTGWR